MEHIEGLVNFLSHLATVEVPQAINFRIVFLNIYALTSNNWVMLLVRLHGYGLFEFLRVYSFDYLLPTKILLP